MLRNVNFGLSFVLFLSAVFLLGNVHAGNDGTVVGGGVILYSPMQVHGGLDNQTRGSNKTTEENSVEYPDRESSEAACRDCIREFESAARLPPKKASYVSPMTVSPEAERTFNMTSASLTYSKPLMPSGYPATRNPVVYAHQNITIDGTVRNLGTGLANVSIVVTIKNALDDATVATVYSGSTVLSAAGGETESKTIEAIAGHPVVWDTAANVGEFYVWVNVTPAGASSFTLDTKSNRFSVGYTMKASFSGCQTNNSEYYPGDVVQLSGNCSIANTGNQVISGFVAVQIHKYDSENREWNRGVGWPIDIITPVAVVIGVNQNYSVAGSIGAVRWNITNATQAGTYRMMVAIIDSFGTILKQYVGSNVVDTMENSLPGVMVEKFIDPTLFDSGGNKSTNVTLRVRHSGHSVRDAGVFATGSEARDFKTPLDVTFVVDTSGSMSDDWESLTVVMQNIISKLSQDADIRHEIFALEDHNNGDPVVPVIVETISLPSTVNVLELLNASTAEAEVTYGVQLPITNSSPKHLTDKVYSGQDLGWNHLFPNNTVEHEVIEESDGNRTLILRVYPVRYNESNRTVYVYRNIAFGYVKQNVSVPLTELEVMTELSASQFAVSLRNKGDVDIENAVVTSFLPTNVSAAQVSDSGTYNSGNKTIEWRVSSIPSSGSDSIKTRYANINIASAGNYTINTTVTYYGQGSANASTIRKTNTAGLEEASLTSTTPINLTTGWNLISIPLNL